MLINAFLKLHEQIQKSPHAFDRVAIAREVERAAMSETPLIEQKGLLA